MGQKIIKMSFAEGFIKFTGQAALYVAEAEALLSQERPDPSSLLLCKENLERLKADADKKVYDFESALHRAHVLKLLALVCDHLKPETIFPGNETPLTQGREYAFEAAELYCEQEKSETFKADSASLFYLAGYFSFLLGNALMTDALTGQLPNFCAYETAFCYYFSAMACFYQSKEIIASPEKEFALDHQLLIEKRTQYHLALSLCGLALNTEDPTKKGLYFNLASMHLDKLLGISSLLEEGADEVKKAEFDFYENAHIVSQKIQGISTPLSQEDLKAARLNWNLKEIEQQKNAPPDPDDW